MTDRQTIDRRSFLRSSMALGLGSLGLALGAPASGFAEGGAPLNAKVLSSSGTWSLLCVELMRRKGFFQQFGINAEMQTVSDGSKIIAGIVSGSGDLCGGGGFSGLFPAIEKGAKIKIISGALLSPVTAIFSKRPDVRSAKDLVGKSVGIGSPGALLHELVVALLIKKGIDYGKVNFVNVGSAPEIFEAVVNGVVDAGPGEVDVYYEQKKYGVHALTDGALWDELPEYTDQAMFASERTIAEKRELLVRCLAAYSEMYRFVESPTSFDAWRIARAAALGKDDYEQALIEWRFFNKPGRLATNLLLTEANTDYVQKLNVKLGSQKRVLPFDQVADMSLAQDALKLLGQTKT